MIKQYDPATTPHRRAVQHKDVATKDKNILADTYAELNRAAIQREIQALTDRLLKITSARLSPPQTVHPSSPHARIRQ